MEEIELLAHGPRLFGEHKNMNVGDRIYRDATSQPIRDNWPGSDEASAGLQHGDEGEITEIGNVGACVVANVLWDREKHKGWGYARFYPLDKEYFRLVGEAPKYPDETPKYPKINPVIDLSRCCSCPRPNEYDNDANCDDGWRCGECRVIRSLQ